MRSIPHSAFRIGNMPLRAIYFDAGNTLVFPDLGKTLAPLAARGLRAVQEQLYAAERAAKRRLDAAHASDPYDRSVDQQFWDIYYQHLLGQLGRSDPQLQAELVAATRQSRHWCRSWPRTRQILGRLRRRYRLGMISNSDGHIAELMRDIGLGDCFESFTDSGLVGYEKPDPRIFQVAMQSLSVTPEESMYVGDVYSVDYAGARSAGMRAILLDVSGTYRESDLPRVESLAELEAHLT